MNRLLALMLLALACVAVVRGEEEAVEDLPSPTTIFFTAPPGEAPFVIESVGFTPGSVAPFTDSPPSPSGPFIAPVAIWGLILGIIGAWLLLLLICFIIILLIFMSGGSGKFDSTVRSHTTDAVDSDIGTTTAHSAGGDNKTTIEFTDL